MKRDATLVAQKLETFFDHETQLKEPKNEPGIFTNLLCIGLMASAVFLTKISLFLTRFVKRLEAK